MNNPSSPTQPLGAFLREKRQNKGLSVRKVCEAINADANNIPTEMVSPTYLSDIETGRRTPSDRALKNICTVLKITEEEVAKHDMRVPAQEIRDLATANQLYGKAFRRIVSGIQQNNISADELLARLERILETRDADTTK